MTLEPFFREMEAMLLGRKTAAEVEQVLGPSPSGTDHFAFYRTLLDRNFHKILRLLFPAVASLAKRERDGLWTEIVREYVDAHPPRGCRDPNQIGAAFAEYLADRRERRGDLPPIAEELAEYQFIDYVAKTAQDVSDDGMEKRLFIRQFTHHIPDYMRAIVADASAPLPEPAPTIVVLYRSLLDGEVRVLYPRPATLAVLARRQGLKLPPPLSQLDPDDVNLTELRLVEMGVLGEVGR